MALTRESYSTQASRWSLCCSAQNQFASFYCALHKHIFCPRQAYLQHLWPDWTAVGRA